MENNHGHLADIKDEQDSCDSDSIATVMYDISQINKSVLNREYRIHENDAAPISDLNEFFDGEDGDLVVSSAASKNRSIETQISLDGNVTPKKRDMPNKEDYILNWAKSQTELSPTVASILSDHDYLSQENLRGIINSNDQQQKLNDSNRSSDKLSALSCDGDSSDTNDINDLKNCFGGLSPDLKSSENQIILNKIVDKVKQIQTRVNGNHTEVSTGNTSPAHLFSSNHSEPLEYYDNIATNSESISDPVMSKLRETLKTVAKMHTRIATDMDKVSRRLDVIVINQNAEERQTELNEVNENFGLLIEDIANELHKIASELKGTATQQKPNENTASEQNELKGGVSGVADEINVSLLTTTESNKESSSTEGSEMLKLNSEGDGNQNTAQLLNEAAKEGLLAESSSSSDSNGTMFSLPKTSQRIKKKKLKKRKTKKQFTAEDSTDYTSSDDSDFEKTKKELNSPSEQSIVSDRTDGQRKDDANKPNGEIENGMALPTNFDADSDFFGFENSNELEIGVKTEIASQQSQLKQPSLSISQNEVSENNDGNVQNQSTAGSLQEGDEINSLSDSDSGGAEEADSDDDDDDIRKLLDFSSLGVKRKVQPNQLFDHNYGDDAVPSNHVPTANKKPPTKPQAKEDELGKLLESGVADYMNNSGEEDEKSDGENIITEEQYLEERNDLVKKQLLMDSSSESIISDEEFDDLRQANGHSNDDNSDDSNIDDDHESVVSDTGSIMEDFLKFSEKIVKKEKIPATEANENEVILSDNDNDNDSASIQSKENLLNAGAKRRRERFSDLEELSDSNGEVVPKKKKISTIGQHIGASLEKDCELIVPSDDDSPKKVDGIKNNGDASGGSVVLDTTMFKKSVKEVNTHELSKKLQSDRTKQLLVTSRADDVVSLSSDDDDDEMEPHSTEKPQEKETPDEEKRKKRKLLRDDQLADDTKVAQKEESERIKRLEAKKKHLTQFLDSQKSDSNDSQAIYDDEILLDYDSKRKEKILVHPEIRKQLKDHQVDGIRFMYDCCYGSVNNIEKDPGSGCILAHCMGLGKTLQLITLLHTAISYPQLKTDRILVICPKSTVMNWKDEIERWLKPIKNSRTLKLYQFPESSNINAKLKVLKEWSLSGKGEGKQAGCLLMGYEAFRMLVFYHQSRKTKQNYAQTELTRLEESVSKYLLKPGADLVVCDEGHMIKNQKSATSLAVNKIRTRRRIVLTGTPIQNNLKEYYSMVNFIKPSFLGTEKEFANLYVNPIKSGQHKDSSRSEIKHMKQRSYVLHKKLSKFVQRREAALLKSFLPTKYEFVLFIPMTEAQNKLYEYFLEHNPNKDRGGKSLLADYTILRKIWTHPKVLEKAYLNAVNSKTKIKAPVVVPTTNQQNNDSDDDQPDDIFDSQTGEMSVKNDWWRSHLKAEDLETILPSNKLSVLFEILDQCVQNNEKCLIFSAFVAVLDVVEFFMNAITKQNKTNVPLPGLERFHKQHWEYGTHYYRLDGKTPKNRRHEMITNFNGPHNQQTRAFLISAKAGGQGINLIGANRVILLDTSWNPSNDQQNIFRVFRLGQKRICCIYRLLAMGTMEEKVYSRSVTKQAMSFRVVDEQQIDRHYSMAELQELYILTKPSMEDRETPMVPKDSVLAHLVRNYPQMVYKYHEHDSLLENKNEQELSEEDKADAWAAYEADVKRKNETNFGPYNNSYGMMPNMAGNLSAYANPFYGNYNNLSSALNYPFGSSYGQFNPFASDYNSMGFGDYTSFYNNLMSPNYNQNNTNMLSPTHSSSVSSPSPLTSSFTSARNWMQSLASSSNYGNNILSTLAQSTNTSPKSGYNSYIDLCTRLGTKNTILPTSNTSPPNANSPPSALPGTSLDFEALVAQQLSSMVGSSLNAMPPAHSPTQQQQQQHLQLQQQQQLLLQYHQAQQGPKARNNPMLSKELMQPTRDIFPAFSSIPTSVITKPSNSTATSNANDAGQTSTQNNANASKSIDAGVSSTNDRVNGRTQQEPQLLIKNVVSLNNSIRNSPDITKQPPINLTKASDKDAGSSGVTSTVVDNGKKVDGRKSTNMGIVYPKTVPAQPTSKAINLSSHRASTPLLDKPRNSFVKTATLPTSKTPIPLTSKPPTPSTPSSPIISKSSLPFSVTKVTTIPKSIAPANDTGKLTQSQFFEKELKRFLSSSSAAPKPTILNKASAQPTATIIKKPVATNLDAATSAVQQINNNKALTVISTRVPVTSDTAKRTTTASTSNAAIPVAISRAQPSLLAKNSNVVQILPSPSVVKAAEPPSITVIPRPVNVNAINEKMPTALSNLSSVSIEKIPPKPIIANTKTVPTAKPGIVRKIAHPLSTPASPSNKRPKLALSKTSTISGIRPIGITKSRGLENIRTIPRPSQHTNADAPMEIVELE